MQSHTAFGLKAGLTEAQIRDLDVYKDSPAYDTFQKLVLCYAEDLTRKVRTEPHVLEGLKQVLTEKELVELAMAVGLANLTSRVVESFRLSLP